MPVAGSGRQHTDSGLWGASTWQDRTSVTGEEDRRSDDREPLRPERGEAPGERQDADVDGYCPWLRRNRSSVALLAER